MDYKAKYLKYKQKYINLKLNKKGGFSIFGGNSINNKFVLITTYYEPDNQERSNEIKECLIRNFSNKYLDKIHLLNDKIYDLSFIPEHEKKIVQVIVDDDNKKRLGFDCAISYINENLSDVIAILSNSDIYFDNTLGELVNYDFDNKFLALSRYENDVLHDRKNSQDTWIFKPKLRVNISDCNFKFGIMGCDNRIAANVYKMGYIVLNPSKTIKTHHIHTSAYRTYKYSYLLSGWYYFIETSTINEKNSNGKLVFVKEGETSIGTYL